MMNNYGRRKKLILLSIPVLIIAVYSFTQTTQVPLTPLSAEKVLSARDILSGKRTLLSWRYHLPELPVYLLCVKIFGLSTFSAIAANTLFFMSAFCAGVFIISARYPVNLSNLLIWIAVTGLPDPVWISSFQIEPFLICAMILLPHFICGYHEKRRAGITAVFILFCISAVFPLPDPGKTAVNTRPVHETLRALQAVFRADFSLQPVMRPETGRYFLMTVVLLLTVWSIFRTLRLCFREKNRRNIRTVYAVLMILTILFCFLPITGDRDRKTALCAWIPFGAAFLLMRLKDESSFRDLRLARQRVSLDTIVIIFAVLTILFEINPIVSSRPASPADRVVIYLNEQNRHHGYCEPADLALLTVASKGQIVFTTDPADGENTFSVLSSAETAGNDGQSEIIPPYQILIY